MQHKKLHSNSIGRDLTAVNLISTLYVYAKLINGYDKKGSCRRTLDGQTTGR